jgi:hypothetical protein
MIAEISRATKGGFKTKVAVIRLGGNNIWQMILE